MRVSTKDLRAALGAVGSAVSSRPGIPALTGVRIVAGAGRLELTTTDLEASAVAEVGAEAEPAGETWSALAPFRMLKDAARSYKGETFSLRPDGAGSLTINGAGSLRLLPLEDFPTWPTPAELVGSFDAGSFRRLVESVAPACSSDEARPVLTGALLELDAGDLKLTATDSYRLHHGELVGTNVDGKAIVPGRALRSVSKLIGAKGEGTVLVRGDLEQGSALSFEVKLEGRRSVVICSRVIEGEFPNYAQLMPDTGAPEYGRLRYDAGAMAELVGNVAPFCRDTTPARLAFNALGVSMSGSSPDLGEYRGELEADWSGEDVSVAFNPTYLGGALAALADAPAPELLIRDGLKPGVVRSDGDTLRRSALIMPVRLPTPVDTPAPVAEDTAEIAGPGPIHEPTASERETGEPVASEVVDVEPAPVDLPPAPEVERETVAAAVSSAPIPEPTTTDWAELAHVGEVGSGRSRLVVRVIGGPDGTPWVDARRFVTSARYDGPTRKGWAIPAAIVADVIALLEDARAAAETV